MIFVFSLSIKGRQRQRQGLRPRKTHRDSGGRCSRVSPHLVPIIVRRMLMAPESQRKELNFSLIRSLRNADPGHALSELEDQTIEAQPADYPLSRGPFGVFQVQAVNLGDSPAPVGTGVDPLADSNALIDDLVDPTLGDTGDAASLLDPATLDMGVNDGIEEPAVLDHDPIFLADSMLMQNIGLDDSVARLYDNYEVSHFNALDGSISHHNFLCPSPQAARFPGDSWLLLSNYRDKVVPLLSPLNSSAKSPWHHLVLPCAMNTMAEMTMGGTTNYARSALLHTLLATSASHIQLSSFSCPGESWNLTVHYYKQRARNDLRRCLQEETSSRVKKAKYKDILMALLSMAVLNVCFLPAIDSANPIELTLSWYAGIRRRCRLPTRLPSGHRKVHLQERIKQSIPIAKDPTSAPLLRLLTHIQRVSGSVRRVHRPFSRPRRGPRSNRHHESSPIPHFTLVRYSRLCPHNSQVHRARPARSSP